MESGESKMLNKPTYYFLKGIIFIDEHLKHIYKTSIIYKKLSNTVVNAGFSFLEVL